MSVKGMASSSRARIPHSPPESYLFNNFVVDLSKKITRQEVDELKRRFHGIIGDTVQSAEKMFDVMRDKGYIDHDNILYIQQIIRVLNREDLLEIAAEYLRRFEEDDVLHFFKKRTEPADGCSIVQFHVVGHRISNRKDLETLRKRVSKILLLSPDEVIFKGVQATSSTLITLMLPTMYVEFLKSQIGQNKQYMISSLIEQGVDLVRFSTVEFTLKKDGTYFISKKGQVSEQTDHQKTTSKVTERREQTSASLQTNSKPLHGKRHRPEQSIKTRSNTQRLSPERKSMRIQVGEGMKQTRATCFVYN